MKTRRPFSPQGVLCAPLLSLLLLSGCSSESRDRLWQTLDPAGYKHSHSESFNGARAVPYPSMKPASDEMALEIER